MFLCLFGFIEHIEALQYTTILDHLLVMFFFFFLRGGKFLSIRGLTVGF